MIGKNHTANESGQREWRFNVNGASDSSLHRRAMLSYLS